VHTMRPWLVCWEQKILSDLFLPEERRTYFAEFLVDALLRGDIESRYKAYAIARQWGWLSADDIRELENMNPLPDGQGKVYLVPLNMMPASSAVASAVASPARGQIGVQGLEGVQGLGMETREEHTWRFAENRRRLAKQFERLFRSTEKRIVEREAAEVMKAAEKHLRQRDSQTFDVWLQQFYKEHEDFMTQAWTPVYLTYADTIQVEVAEEINASPGMTYQLENFVRNYIASHVALHAGSALGQLRQVLREAVLNRQDEVQAIQERLDEWKEKRPDKIAMVETVQFANALAREIYKSNGVRKLKWVNFEPSCPYCRYLGGKVVGIESVFIPAGMDFQPEGAERPLRPTTNILHPPAHMGCECQIVACYE